MTFQKLKSALQEPTLEANPKKYNQYSKTAQRVIHSNTTNHFLSSIYNVRERRTKIQNHNLHINSSETGYTDQHYTA